MGYGIVDTDGRKHALVVHGAIKAPRRASFPVRLLNISDHLASIIEKYSPQVCSIEETFYHVNVKTSLKLGHVRGVALLAAVPESDFAYATFVNSSVSGAFQAALQRWITTAYGFGTPDTVAGRPMAAARPGAAAPVDRSPFVGTYRRTTTRVTIRDVGGKLMLEREWILSEAQGTEAYIIGQPTVFEMVPVSANALALASADPAGPRALWTFLEPDAAGRFRLMYANGRLARRIA
jgi:hypothetical protein